MRKAFIKTLTELAEEDDRIYLLTADMGFNIIEPFTEKFPKRFINVGVAEQNMIGVATGLALSGKIVFVYSAANFPTLRCLEQIRNDVCYHNARVHIVAVGTGLAYGAYGFSHHSTEDISVMRSLPNMTVVAPALSEVVQATRAIYEHGSPCYLRLGWAAEDEVTNLHKFEIGKAITMMGGNGVCLISAGSMLPIAMEVGNKINSTVLSMHTIKPIDAEAIITVSRMADIIVTIEEHNIIGGLGSAVAEVIADNSLRVKLKRIGLPDEYCTKVGSRDELLGSCHLTADDIANEVKNVLC